MKTLICMGDSLTEGADIPTGHTWPELTGNALGIEVVNDGIGGDTTAGMLARFHPEVIAQKPAFALILGGTNDLWWGLSVNTILANLFSMIVQARRHGIAPVLALPLPVHTEAADKNEFSPPRDGYDRFVEEMKRLIKGIEACAEESEVVAIDLHRPFLSEGGRVREELFLPDGLHPNREGHRIIATAVCKTFREHFHFRAYR
jgi:lysophospholipase L1-like esterase